MRVPDTYLPAAELDNRSAHVIVSISATRQLSKLQKVKTDIGRGRAWIRLALNEASMEAYMRNFLDDVSCRMLLSPA